MLVQMTYCEDIRIPNLGANLNQVFSLNSINKPNVTATAPPLSTHQPRGHDEWQKLYTRYCVVGASVTVQPLYGDSDAANNNTTLVGHLDDSPVVVAYPVPTIIELGMRGKSKYLQVGDPSRGVLQKRSPKLHWKIGMKKFFGIKKSTQVIFPSALGLGNDTPGSLGEPDKITSDFGSSPLNQCYLKLACDNSTANPAFPEVTARVTIRYTCLLYDPPEIGGS